MSAMHQFIRYCLSPLILLAFGSAQAGAESLQPVATGTAGCTAAAQRIDEERFVKIGGIEQWITIHGADCRNPVVLFLHGGPGNPLSPFARGIYGEWELAFTLVQWDQRGAGRTFGRNPQSAQEPLGVERMAQDGVELAAYLASYLGQRKVALLAGSWGTALGVHMIKSRPDLFLAYVGAGQLVGRENAQASYRQTIRLARAAGDAKTLAAVEGLGPPPWTDPRAFGILRRATRQYEARMSEPPPRAWWRASAAYASAAAQAAAEAGEDYSYLQFVGLEGDGMFWKIDLPRLGLAFDVPIFMIQGEHDLVTVPEVAKRYYDSITAPHKEYVLLPRTGHDPNQMMVDAEYKLLKERVAPLRR